jgi:D-alanine-D-alanine ligase
LRVGIAFDLKSDFTVGPGDPEDRLEEYDSAATVDGIAAGIAANGHEAVHLGGGRRLLERLLSDPPDLVFNVAEGHGTRSREAHVPAVCEMLRIPFTHSDPLTLAVTLDKAVAKKLAAADGVPTPRWALSTTGEEPALDHLELPVIAKPNAEGSSMGIRRASRLTDRAALRERVRELVRAYGQPVLVEEFCPGVEYTVGVLGTAGAARTVAAMEIVPKRVPAAEFVYSLEVKRDWEEEVQYHVPPRQPAELVAQIEGIALAAYRSLGCRDVGRVDVRLGADGEPRFLEVNPLPGLNPRTGDLPILARMAGMPYERLIGAILDSASERRAA